MPQKQTVINVTLTVRGDVPDATDAVWRMLSYWFNQYRGTPTLGFEDGALLHYRIEPRPKMKQDVFQP